MIGGALTISAVLNPILQSLGNIVLHSLQANLMTDSHTIYFSYGKGNPLQDVEISSFELAQAMQCAPKEAAIRVFCYIKGVNTKLGRCYYEKIFTVGK